MKKQPEFILLILCIIISQSITGQVVNDSLVKINRVQSIKEFTIKMEKGKIISSELIGYNLFNSDYKLIEDYSKTYPFKHEYKYNSEGILIKKIKLDNQNNDEIERVWEYEYDNEKLVKEVSYWIEFKGKHPVLYEYNQKNQLISINHLNNKKEVYKSINQKYYESGELFEKKHEEKYNKSAFKIQHFDKCGNLIYLFKNGKQDSTQINYDFILHCSDLSLNQDFTIDTIYNNANTNEYLKYILQDNIRKSIYSYDILGNLTKVAKYQFKQDGTINQSEEKSYNEKGQLIQVKEINHWKIDNYSTKIHKATNHKNYEYYQNGILHKIYFLDENGMIYKINEYKIEYKK